MNGMLRWRDATRKSSRKPQLLPHDPSGLCSSFSKWLLDENALKRLKRQTLWIIATVSVVLGTSRCATSLVLCRFEASACWFGCHSAAI